MCFIGRYEHKDPINYALKKIVKLRELIRVDNAFTRLYDGFEEELEAFITKMLELCRSTNEAEIFLSPKDADERLPHLYPRLWYTVGQKLQRFVSSPNAQSVRPHNLIIAIYSQLTLLTIIKVHYKTH